MASARQLLVEAGWSPGREVDATAEVDALAAEGLPTGKWVVRFLQEFGGLTVRFVLDEVNDELVLSARAAMRHWYSEAVKEYSERVGVGLIPIGYTYQGHLLLLRAADGRWFGGFDATLGELGRGNLDAIERIVENRGFSHEY